MRNRPAAGCSFAAANSGRVGLPVSIRRARPAGRPVVRSKLSASTAAKRAVSRLARPNTAFCSCTSTGTRLRPAATVAGTEA